MNQTNDTNNCDMFFDFAKESFSSLPASERQIENNRSFIYHLGQSFQHKYANSSINGNFHRDEYIKNFLYQGEVNRKSENELYNHGSSGNSIHEIASALRLYRNRKNRSRESSSPHSTSSLNDNSKSIDSRMEEQFEGTDIEREEIKPHDQLQHKIIAKPGPKIKIRRKAWQLHEDEQLLRLIQVHGMKWAKIASIMKDRTGKQIRDRYLNNLNPEIREKEWTSEEDQLLLYLFFNWGKKWSKIAASLPGRSEGQVKNRFSWELKRKGLCYPFVNLNLPQTALNPHLQHLMKANGTIKEIPRLNLGQMSHQENHNIYFDYPTDDKNSTKEENTLNPQTGHNQALNPDDFISYADTPDTRDSSLSNYSSFTPQHN